MMSSSTTRTELPLADLAGAEIHSAGWVCETPRVFAVWYVLPDGSVALATFTLGAGLGQDMRPRIVAGPDL